MVLGSEVPCFSPLKGYYGRNVNPETGKRPLVFDVRKSYSGIAVIIPCGGCIGCRLERSRQWALRCMHEMRLHKASAFVTLTYDDKHLPSDYSLRKRDLQLFMKRFRHLRPDGVRFFACGEYGELTLRPHYHVLFLNTDFPDMKFYKLVGEHSIYESKELDDVWGHGECKIGNVTAQSCSYVARYCLKKVTGKNAAAHYGSREPEFAVMSRRPGVGGEWFDRYHGEAYDHDSAIMDAREVPLPRYYDAKYEVLDSRRLEKLKKLRRLRALLKKADNTPERRRVRERFEELKAARFARETVR